MQNLPVTDAPKDQMIATRSLTILDLNSKPSSTIISICSLLLGLPSRLLIFFTSHENFSINPSTRDNQRNLQNISQEKYLANLTFLSCLSQITALRIRPALFFSVTESCKLVHFALLASSLVSG